VKITVTFDARETAIVLGSLTEARDDRRNSPHTRRTCGAIAQRIRETRDAEQAARKAAQA
jgi:hypothetical protein